MPRGRKATTDTTLTGDSEQAIGVASEIGSETRFAGIELADFASESPEELGTFSTAADAPELGTTETRTTGTGKKRGRPAGSKNSTKKISPVQNDLKIDKLTDLLTKCHIGLAAMTKCPELLIDPEESKDMVVSTLELAEFYDLNPSPKTVAWVNFAGTVGKVYVTRAMAIVNRSKEESKKKSPATPAEKVVTINA